VRPGSQVRRLKPSPLCRRPRLLAAREVLNRFSGSESFNDRGGSKRRGWGALRTYVLPPALGGAAACAEPPPPKAAMGAPRSSSGTRADHPLPVPWGTAFLLPGEKNQAPIPDLLASDSKTHLINCAKIGFPCNLAHQRHMNPRHSNISSEGGDLPLHFVLCHTAFQSAPSESNSLASSHPFSTKSA